MTPRERRQPLIDAMAGLAARGADCAGCSGVCCTFVANSMQITAVEAGDILAYLRESGRLDEGEVERWRQTVATFGLDRPVPGDGRRTFVRRRYTCSFHAGGRLGCTLPAEVKPYGCLAFNATRPGVREGESCASDPSLLTGDESWAKRPIPQALLALLAAGPAADAGANPSDPLPNQNS